jgi:hypothetical protein
MIFLSGRPPNLESGRAWLEIKYHCGKMKTLLFTSEYKKANLQ